MYLYMFRKSSDTIDLQCDGFKAYKISNWET